MPSIAHQHDGIEHPLPNIKGSRYGRQAIASECERIEDAPVGRRTHVLFAAGCAMGQLIAGRELDEYGAATTLEAMGRAIGLTDAEVKRTVRRGIEKGKEKPRQASKTYGNGTDGTLLVMGWWGDVMSHDWKGRRAATTLKILAGFAVLAAGAHKLTLSDSFAQVAEAAGVSKGTISKHRVDIAPWVRVVRKGHPMTGAATVWQLVSPERSIGNSPTPSLPGYAGLFPNARTLTDPAHNYWHGWATGWMMWLTLSANESMTARELAEATGFSPSTARRALNRFRTAELAFRDGDGGWTTVEGATAESRSGRDHALERKARHYYQRLEWRMWVKETIAAKVERREKARSRRTCRDVDPDTGEVYTRAA